MSEVEKMYENTEVKADRIVCYRGFDNCVDNDFNCHCHNEKPCEDAAKIYPPFTAEKQIELIKFLMEQEDFSWTIAEQGKDTEYVFYVGYEYSSEGFKEFPEALAGIINNLWQDLTEKERKQIKEILE